MPLFATLFSAMFSGFGVFLAKILAAKIAARALGVAALLALTVGLVAAFNLAIAPFAGAIFQTQYGQFLGLAFPPISGTVMTALLAFWTVVMVYRLQSRLIALTANV